MPMHGKGNREYALQLPVEDCHCKPCNKERMKKVRQEAKRREREEQKRQRAAYDSVTNRPQGELEAGNTFVNGQPAYYEDGGQSGIAGQRDRYYGPNGPFGNDHVHNISNDGGETWRRGPKG